MDSDSDTPSRGWVAPFGDPRINGRSPLPSAYRSVPRPSSPLGAKASTRCPSRPTIAHAQPPARAARGLQRSDGRGQRTDTTPANRVMTILCALYPYPATAGREHRRSRSLDGSHHPQRLGQQTLRYLPMPGRTPLRRPGSLPHDSLRAPSREHDHATGPSPGRRASRPHGHDYSCTMSKDQRPHGPPSRPFPGGP